eukprot:6207461-Pleurochrysis_carterae.AAC.1
MFTRARALAPCIGPRSALFVLVVGAYACCVAAASVCLRGRAEALPLSRVQLRPAVLVVTVHVHGVRGGADWAGAAGEAGCLLSLRPRAFRAEQPAAHAALNAVWAAVRDECAALVRHTGTWYPLESPCAQVRPSSPRCPNAHDS